MKDTISDILITSLWLLTAWVFYISIVLAMIALFIGLDRLGK